MPLQLLHTPLDTSRSVGECSFPRTRADALALARLVVESNKSELHIVAVVEDDESCGPIEVARVELSRSESEVWYLQYVSHPSQSMGLTSFVLPSEGDLMWRVHRWLATDWTPVVEVLSSDEMSSEGLGPCALLDLRVANSFPVVPGTADAALLRSAASASLAIEPTGIGSAHYLPIQMV